MLRQTAPRKVARPAVLVLLAALAALGLVAPQRASAASATCPNGSTMYIVAHEDDSILFQSPDLLHDIQSGRCVRTVFVTAGDAGGWQSYWSSREQGAEAAYADMAGVPNTWTTGDAGIAGHPMPLLTLAGAPNVSIVFMRLPDGNLDGSGFPSQNHQSLQKLYTGAIAKITAVDGSTSYGKAGLTAALTALMRAFVPDKIATQDFAGTFCDGDHSDHHAVAYFTRIAHRAWKALPHTVVGYMDYPSSNQPANVSGADLTAKRQAWFAYTPFDQYVCQTVTQCSASSSEWQWLSRQYTTGTEAGGPGVAFAPMAYAGPDQTVRAGATVGLDGSASSDPGTSPAYHWTQTAGPPVTLSSSTTVAPSFTAPGTAAVLKFQLVVTDGALASPPATVTIGVFDASNVAPAATATASSETLGACEQAAKAVDGVVDGYPGDGTREWATNGGRAGSWLNLSWSAAKTINSVVLYDRPNANDQITGGQLTFSDGTTVAVPSLNNDGSATTVTFPAVATTSLKFTVTSVSATTVNAGLAELQAFAGGTAPQPPTADAGADQTLGAGGKVQLNASGSTDPNGSPTYRWTQTAGPAVQLRSPSAIRPTFTAPAGAATLTFKLVVSDGSLVSAPDTVTVTVLDPAADLGPAATVTASSESAPYQLAVKAVDGVVDGYPGDSSREWATNGGRAGSWLDLAWGAPQTIDTVVLYDRPNANDRITGARLTFSDGTTVAVPALNNDGTATAVTFPPVTTTSLRMTVTTVSASTLNVGLAEIQVY